MTYEDVKRIRNNPTSEDVDNEELQTLIDLAIEKQIPKNPIYSPPLGSREDWYCPVCESMIAYNSYVSPERGKSCRNYCDNCGQKIDWSKSIPWRNRNDKP